MAAHSQRPQCAEEWEQRLSSSNPTFMDQDRQEGLVCVGGVHGVGEQTRRHEGAGWGPEQPQPGYCS